MKQQKIKSCDMSREQLQELLDKDFIKMLDKKRRRKR